MKVILLAGGHGTRISEESISRPKPMVEIGGHPILWHIMKYYSSFGFKDFVICAGYKSYYIKEYFLNYFSHRSDFTIDLATGVVVHHVAASEKWSVSILDTGEDALTGDRVLAALEFFPDDEQFCLTYGDGLSDIDLDALIQQHRKSGLQMTLTGIPARGKFGLIKSEMGRVKEFSEKPTNDSDMINGGFFIFDRKAFDNISRKQSSLSLEFDILPQIVEVGQLGIYRHTGFWQSMDTLRDRFILEDHWRDGAPWKRW